MNYQNLQKCGIDEIKKDKLAQWMLFINDPESVEVKEIMEENNDIKQAVETLEEISDDKEMRRLAELREKAKLDEISWAYNAEQRGHKKKAKPVVKKLGMQKSKIEIAKKMLKNKMDIDTIIELTGLAREEIEKLLN